MPQKKSQLSPEKQMEREIDMYHTLILAINDKLPRMTMPHLQEVYRVALKAVEDTNKGRETFFED